MPVPVLASIAFFVRFGTSLYKSFFGKKIKQIRKSPAYKVRETEETLSYENPVPIVYGHNKVEGHIIYREQNSERIFDLAIGICEGEIEEIKNIKINDIPIDEIPIRSLTDTTISFLGEYIYDSNNRFDSVGFKKSGSGTEEKKNYIIIKGSDHNDGAYGIREVWNNKIRSWSTFINEDAGATISLTTGIGYRKYKGTSNQDGDDIFKKGFIKLNPTEDAHIWEGSPDANYGSEDGLVVRIRGTGMPDRSWVVLKFDFSNMPAGLVIESAKLKIPVYENAQQSELGKVGLYRATSETGWTEDNLTWNTKPSTSKRISNWLKTKKTGSIQEFAFNDEWGIPFLQTQYNAGGDATIFIKDKETVPLESWYELEYTSKESVYAHAILEIHYSGGTPQGYRNTAYIAITLDTQEEKIGGSTPRITAEVKGRLIKNWTGSAYQTTYNNNPAWVIRDLVTNTRYGIGIDESNLDLDSFKTVADYCDVQIAGEDGDENRFECDVVLDEYQDAYESIQELLLTVRGRLFPLDGKIHIAIESSGSSDHVFTEDNILPDSFSYFEADKNEIPNTIRVLFTNASKDFKLDYAQIEDGIDLETRDRVIDEIQCYSINRRSQALRFGNFLLWKGKYCNKACTFRVSINNCNVAVNDICRITHSIPDWALKYFRIIQISESFRDEIELTCEEYNADIYYEGGIPDIYNETPDLPPLWERPPNVTSLTLAETHEILDDGTYIPQIIVTFIEPDYAFPLHYLIWIKKEGDNWKPWRTIYTNTCTISVDEVADYYIKVQSVNDVSGSEMDFDDSPQSSIALVGQSDTPSIPTAAGIVWSTDSKAEWTTGRIYYKGTAYEIASGNTTNTYIYFDPDISGTVLQTSNTRPTINSNTWIMATYDSSSDEITPAQGFKLLHATILQAGTITAAEIKAGTITVTELNFTPVDSTTIVATINATSEGIEITANLITIAGTTTFTSGWAAAGNAESDINVLNTTNAPAEAGADITLTHTAANITGQGDLALKDIIGAVDVDTTIIDGGKIITGLLTATNIQTGTLTAITMQTASSNQRIVLSQADNTLRFYNSSGNEVITIDDNLLFGGPAIKLIYADSASGTFYNYKDVDNYTFLTFRRLHLESKPASNANIIEVAVNTVNQFIVDDGGNVYAKGTIEVDGQADFDGNVDCNAGLDVTGNITVTGTVDTIDIAIHIHDASAGHGAKITHTNILGVNINDHHAQSHNNTYHTTNYASEAAFLNHDARHRKSGADTLEILDLGDAGAVAGDYLRWDDVEGGLYFSAT